MKEKLRVMNGEDDDPVEVVSMGTIIIDGHHDKDGEIVEKKDLLNDEVQNKASEDHTSTGRCQKGDQVKMVPNLCGSKLSQIYTSQNGPRFYLSQNSHSQSKRSQT